MKNSCIIILTNGKCFVGATFMYTDVTHESSVFVGNVCTVHVKCWSTMSNYLKINTFLLSQSVLPAWSCASSNSWHSRWEAGKGSFLHLRKTLDLQFCYGAVFLCSYRSLFCLFHAWSWGCTPIFTMVAQYTVLVVWCLPLSCWNGKQIVVGPVCWVARSRCNPWPAVQNTSPPQRWVPLSSSHSGRLVMFSWAQEWW